MTANSGPESQGPKGPEEPTPKPLDPKPQEENPIGPAEQGIINSIHTDGDPDKVLKDIAGSGNLSVPTGWESVGKNPGEEDFQVTPERRAEEERIAARKEAAARVVEALIPSSNMDELVAKIKANASKPVQEFPPVQPPVDDSDWVGIEDATPVQIVAPSSQEDLEARSQAQKRLNQEQRYKADVATELAKTGIPEIDLMEYGQNIIETAKDVVPPNESISFYTLRDFISNAESLEEAKLFAGFAKQWKEKFLSTSPDNRVWKNRARDFSRLIHDLSGKHTFPRPEPMTLEETADIFGAVVEAFDSAYKLPETEEDNRIFREFSFGVETLGIETRNKDQIQRVTEIFKQVADDPDKGLVESFMGTVVTYARHQELTDDTARGFTEKLLPAMRSNDSQVGILIKGGNVWGMKAGEFGAADFLAHCYALRISPVHINELLMAAREVPTTDLARLEQNRLDALTLASPFGALRDFIHDQRPYVHEVIEAMVKYYDTGDSKELSSLLDRVDQGYLGSEDRRALLLDRAKYDSPTEERREGDNPNQKTVKPIDILRRLNENTKPVEDTPPVTSDENLNRLLQDLREKGDQANLQQALDYTNSRLLAMMQRGEIGMEPNMILALAYLDNKGFQALQKLKHEDQQGAYKQGWFYSVLRFQELTATSSEYNEDEFQRFVNQVATSESALAAYRLIAQRELENASKLAHIYKASGNENRVGALWSGNITHELIGLTDLRPASTEQGRKLVLEANRRVIEPGYHPGD
jgi:hypothetical protein